MVRRQLLLLVSGRLVNVELLMLLVVGMLVMVVLALGRQQR